MIRITFFPAAARNVSLDARHCIRNVFALHVTLDARHRMRHVIVGLRFNLKRRNSAART
jgi:hypothetical protein